jgi:hypothetical protein
MHRNRVCFWLGVVALLVTGGVLGGCWGVYYPDEVDQWRSSTETRVELVADAVLAKEDTSPTWQLGRYVYKRGGDRLLVVTHITSWPEKRTEDDQPVSDKDRIFERVWVTIPANTPVGKALKVEKLNEAFMAGYDVKGVNEPGFFIQPAHLLGTITILEEGPNEVNMSIDVVCEPQRLLSWRYKQIVRVPVSPHGDFAQQATDEAVQIVGRPQLLEDDAPAPAPEAPTEMAPTTQPAAEPAM